MAYLKRHYWRMGGEFKKGVVPWIKGKKNVFKHFDFNKTNCNENNLISLCYHCHPKVNFDKMKWKKYFIEKMEVLSGTTRIRI